MGADVDMVVIGSGAGGLAAAVAAARAGRRVLVLEQHSLPGGWSHSFTLGGYRFSPGVHYLGQLQEGGGLRGIYEGLGLGEHLTFYELDPAGFDHVHLGDVRFDIPRGREVLEARLVERYPSEARGVRRYLDAVTAIDDQLAAGLRGGLLGVLALPFRAPAILRWGWRTGGDLIGAYVDHPEVRGILAAQAGDHGLPPSRVSAVVHAAIQAHYFDGAWYPKGGGGALPRAHLRVLTRAGGAIRLRAPVARILVERGRALGVRLEDGTEIRADAVVSNADPAVTFDRLVGREHLSRGLRARLDGLEYSTSCLSLFMAARIDPAAHGLDSGNSWIFPDADVDGSYLRGLGPWDDGAAEIPGLFQTVTTLKDPSKDLRGVHTMEAFSFVGYDAYARWEASVAGDRPAGYEEAKRRVRERMLDVLERRIPGLRDALVFDAVGTPLTNAHYCAATRGNLYGTAKLRSQVGPFSLGPRTEIEGLYLCGASTLSHGIAGAARSGIAAARAALGCRTRDLLTEGEPAITLLDAEAARRDRDAACAAASRGG